MNNSLKVSLIALLAIAFGSVRVGAAEYNSAGFSIGARGSYTDPRGAGESTWSPGVQLRFYLLSMLGLELAADYTSATSNDGTPFESKVKTYPVQASVLFHLFSHSRFSPFLIAGADWAHTDVTGPGLDESDERFGGHLGAGVRMFLNERFSLDATYRYLWLGSIDNVPDSVKDAGNENTMITAGLNFHFL